MTNIAGIGKQPCEPAGHSDEVTPDVGRASLKLDDLLRLRRAEQQSQTRMVPGESLPNRRAPALREGPTWKTTHSSVRPTRSQGADAPARLVARDVAAGVDGVTRTLSAWSQTGRQPGQQDPGAHRRGAPQALAPRHPGGRKAARAGLRGLAQLLCRSGVEPVHPDVPPQAATPVDASVAPPVPASSFRLEASGAHDRNLTDTRVHPPPMAGPAVCRQSPEAGAGWFNDHVRICAGGAGAIRIPTATGLHKALPCRTRLRSIWK